MACVTAHTRRRIAVGGQRRRLYTTRAPYWVKGLNFACHKTGVLWQGRVCKFFGQFTFCTLVQYLKKYLVSR